MDDRLNDSQWLSEQYQHRSLQSIADELGVHRNTVRNRCAQFGIERRVRGTHFAGVPKSDEQKRKMSEARHKYWDARPDRTMHRIKVSQGRTKTGTRDGRPYIYVIGRGYTPEHVVVAENKIGRPIAKGEHVHHIDGDKTNNHPDNLQVLTSSEHARLHMLQRKRDAMGRIS